MDQRKTSEADLHKYLECLLKTMKYNAEKCIFSNKFTEFNSVRMVEPIPPILQKLKRWKEWLFIAGDGPL